MVPLRSPPARARGTRHPLAVVLRLRPLHRPRRSLTRKPRHFKVRVSQLAVNLGTRETMRGDVEAIDPGNKAAAEPVGDVAALSVGNIHAMDTNSGGRGVRQFKTYLLHILEKETPGVSKTRETIRGDVEAADPGNKAAAEPVGDVAAAEHESFNQGNGPRVHHWNKLETTSVISPLIFTLSVWCLSEATPFYLKGFSHGCAEFAMGGQGPTRSPRAKESFPSGDLPPPFRLRPSTVSPSKRRIRGYSVRRRGKEL
uniref:Uncharacterized protein n=1 Tax=Zea mays TaxID=4577 RepID=A0A804LFJ0_MAIZE